MNQAFRIGTLLLYFFMSSGVMAMGDGHDAENVILKARYTPIEGSNIEYGQGAIERNELEHFEIVPSVWLIRVAAPGEALDWQRKLNAAVEVNHGCFVVEHPTADELRRVESGEIAFQK